MGESGVSTILKVREAKQALSCQVAEGRKAVLPHPKPLPGLEKTDKQLLPLPTMEQAVCPGLSLSLDVREFSHLCVQPSPPVQGSLSTLPPSVAVSAVSGSSSTRSTWLCGEGS
jgi:hypothetical protein